MVKLFLYLFKSQAAACGTAVVVTPVNKIVYGEKVISLSEGVGTYNSIMHILL